MAFGYHELVHPYIPTKGSVEGIGYAFLVYLSPM